MSPPPLVGPSMVILYGTTVHPYTHSYTSPHTLPYTLHLHLHLHPLLPSKTHTYTRPISETWVLPIPTPAQLHTYGYYLYPYPSEKSRGATVLMATPIKSYHLRFLTSPFTPCVTPGRYRRTTSRAVQYRVGSHSNTGRDPYSTAVLVPGYDLRARDGSTVTLR